LLTPELKVWVAKEISTIRKIYGYRIVLPGFNWGESNFVAEVCEPKVNDEFQSLHKFMSHKKDFVVNTTATEQFQKAFNRALTSKSFFHREFIDGTLYLNFEVEMESNIGGQLELHWFYQQSDDVVVPKRMSTSDGVLQKTYVGMIDSLPRAI
ncbi:hypothetical protein EGH82_14285, partial [Vibrio ponticus]